MDESRRCTARNRQGERCKRAAIKGGTVCPMHGGKAPQVRDAAERNRALAVARAECVTLGIPIEIDPGHALISSLFEREGNVAFYRALVEKLGTGVYGATYHADGGLTGEAKPHVLVELYHRELQARDQVAAGILKAGVEERRIRLAEGQAQQIATFARGLLAELGIDPASAPARAAFRKHLELVAGDAS
jgi:hypothetical protein